VVGQLHNGQVEHEVRQDGAGDPTADLRRGVGHDLDARQAGPAAPPKQPVHGRHQRVEVGPGHRAEAEDEHSEPEHSGQRVLQQLQPHLAG
jgi:hypothetical protein